MADTIKIDIDVSTVKASLDSLKKEIASLDGAISETATAASGSLGKLQSSFDGLKNIQINEQAANSLKSIQTALTGISSGNINKIAAELERLGKLDVSKLETSFRKLSESLSGNLGQHLNAISTAVNNIGGGGNLGKLGNDLQKLAKVDVSKVKVNVEALVNALAGLKMPPGLDHAATVLNSLAVAAKNAATAVKSTSSSNNDAGKAAQAFGREVLNAVGYMANFSVSAGNLVSAFTTMRQQAGSTQGAISSFIQTMGGGAAAFTAFAAGAVVFKGISDVLAPLIQNTVKVTDSITAFKASLDAAIGTAGAGQQAFDALRGITERTGQDLSNATRNYQQFAISSTAAGQSIESTNRIFENFSVGLKATGATTMQTENAFRALTQMFSKGKVQAEELRGQLSEALPGAFQYAAKSINKTTAELDAMLKAGTVTANELIPALGEFMNIKFGDAVAAQLVTATTRINAFNSAMFELTDAFGGGNLGGLAGGFAAGLDKINQALNSEGISTLARAFGDLAGVMLNIAGSAIGGFVEGLMSVFSGIGKLAGYINDAIRYMTDFKGSFIGANAIMETLSSVVAVIAQGLGAYLAITKTVTVATAAWGAASAIAARHVGALNVAATAAGFQGFPAILASAKTSLQAFGTAATSAATYTGAMRTAMESLKAAVTGLSFSGVLSGIASFGGSIGTLIKSLGSFRGIMLALRGIGSVVFGPFGAVLLTAVTLFGDKIVDVGKSIAGFATSVENAEQSTNGLKPTVEVVKESIESLNASLERSPAALVEATRGFFSFQGAQANAAQEAENLKSKISSLKDQMQEITLASNAAARASAEEKAAIGERIQAVGREKSAIDGSIQAMRDRATAIRDNDKAMSGSNQSTNSVSMSLDRLKNSTREAASESRAMSDQSKTLRDQQQSVGAAAAETKREYDRQKDALKSLKEQYENSLETIKEYGVALDDENKKLADTAKGYGATKEQAGQLAHATQELTKSSKEMANEIQASSERNKEAAKFYSDVAAKLQDVQQENVDYVKSLEESGKASEAEIAIQKELIAIRGEALSLAKNLSASEAKQVIVKNLVADMLRGEPDLVNKASKAAEDYAKATGKSLDVQGLIQEALDKTRESYQTQGKAAEEAAPKTKKNAEDTRSAFDIIKAGFNSVVDIGKSFADMSGKITGAVSAFKGLSEVAAPLKQSAEGLTISFPAMGVAIERMSTTTPTLTEAFTKLMPLLISMKDSGELLKTSLPKMAEAFDKMMVSVPSIAEPTAAFAVSLKSVGDQAEPVANVQTALINLITAVTDAVEDIKSAATAITSLGTSAQDTTDGFNTAIQNVSNYINSLDSLMSKINEVIGRLKEMEEAAKRAAEAASKAGGGGGEAGSSRYGGYSELAPQRESVRDMSVFDNAPQFRDGTANTSNYSSSLPGGGIPSILHPNEAVVPLAKGRKIPVQLDMSNLGKSQDVDMSGVVRSTNQVGDAIQTLATAIRDFTTNASTPTTTSATVDTSAYERALADVYRQQGDNITKMGEVVRALEPTAAQRSVTPYVTPSKDLEAGRYTQRAATTSNTSTTNNQKVEVKIVVNTPDADSFKRTEDQVVKRLSDSINRVTRRNG